MARVFNFDKARKRQEKLKEEMDFTDEEIAAAEQAATARREDLEAQAQAFVDEWRYVYVQKLNRYLRPTSTGWLFCDPASLPRAHARLAIDADFRRIVLAIIPSYGDVTYTFGTVPDDIFNLMSRERWIEPISGQAHHWAFDVLTLSLCGGNLEIVDHLEHLIAFKYLNPGEFRIPSVVAFGEGGTGKNLFVDTILWRIFGGATISVLTDQVLGQFNEIILGMVFLLFNEATDVRTDMLRLKNFLGSQRVAINPKGVAAFWVDNIAMVMFGGDSLDPGIKPHGGGADRRWSVWQVPRGKTLLTWIAEARGWTLAEAKTWLMTVADDEAFKNETEIAKWLGYIIDKHGARPLPQPYQGVAYAEMVATEEPFEERVISAIFEDEDFRNIERGVLFDAYVALCEKHKRKFVMSDRKLFKVADALIAKHGWEIERADITDGTGNAARKRRVFAKSGLISGHDKTETRDRYIDDNDKTSRPRYVGPSID